LFLSVWTAKDLTTKLHLTWYFLICVSSCIRSCLFFFRSTS